MCEYVRAGALARSSGVAAKSSMPQRPCHSFPRVADREPSILRQRRRRRRQRRRRRTTTFDEKDSIDVISSSSFANSSPRNFNDGRSVQTIDFKTFQPTDNFFLVLNRPSNFITAGFKMMEGLSGINPGCSPGWLFPHPRGRKGRV